MEQEGIEHRRHEVTRILASLSSTTGEKPGSTAADLLPLVYDELRYLAASLFVERRRAQTIQPTALVHEAFVRLVRHGGPGWRDREHFYNVAAMAMRQLLADHARRRRARKRGGGWGRVTLDEAVAECETHTTDVVMLDDALTRLAALSPRQAKIAEFRFLAGMSVEQCALALGVSPRTIEREWNFARAWLRRELDGATR